MPLGPRKTDVSYIDPTTMEVKCTFNGCCSKFNPKHSVSTKSPQWSKKTQDSAPTTYTYVDYYHECSDCGRKEYISADQTLSISSYEAAICGHKISDLLSEAKRKKRSSKATTKDRRSWMS
jgi:hypothetical protein